MMRPSWDEYFMAMAVMVSTRATCTRRAVGAVLVKDKRILGTGYNGAPADIPSCLEVGCLIEDGSCKRTVHAETNVVLGTDRFERDGATIYCTDEPCLGCATTVANSGIARFVYGRPYDRTHDQVAALMDTAGVQFERFDLPESPDGVIGLPPSIQAALSRGVIS